jgi:hypothetical protein
MILALLVLEAIALLIVRAATGRGIAARALLSNLLAGGFLLMALRSVLLGHIWGWTAAWLVAAFVAHVTDLSQRWQR